MSATQADRKRAFRAGANLSAKQYFIVKQDTLADDVVLAAAATDAILGILQNAPTQNDTADVLLAGSNGTSKVIAAGVISLGAYVTSDAAGKAVATTSAGDFVIGRALKAAAADGDTIEIALLGFRY